MQESAIKYQKTWPSLRQAHETLLEHLSFLRGKDRRSSTSNDADHTMQQCWSTCEGEASMDQHLPCPTCFQPTTNPIMTTIYNGVTRDRPMSHPVTVPKSNTRSQTDSFESESGFGNGLSPCATSWTLGISDFSSGPSSMIDEREESMSEHSSINDLPDEPPLSSKDTDNIDDDDQEDFEVLSFEGPPESSLFIKEFSHTTSDGQNHVCYCCQIPFNGMPPSAIRRCYYYGKLYCSRCHVNDLAYIPAKIIKSFDTGLYPVCRRAKAILQMNFYQGIFDIQQDNPSLYRSYPILTEIRTLRQQLQHCYAYLSTCTRLSKEQYDKFFEDFPPRDYLYQSIHLYSIGDLLTLKKVYALIRKTLRHAKTHIYHCVICREKGFICEVCKNRSDILYPFNSAKSIGECSQCSNLYHRSCWQKIEEDCPRCYRLIQRRCPVKDDDNDL